MGEEEVMETLAITPEVRRLRTLNALVQKHWEDGTEGYGCLDSCTHAEVPAMQGQYPDLLPKVPCPSFLLDRAAWLAA